MSHAGAMVILVNTMVFQTAAPSLKTAYFNLNICYSNSKIVRLCTLLEVTYERITNTKKFSRRYLNIP
jgi:hypothetical protein